MGELGGTAQEAPTFYVRQRALEQAVIWANGQAHAVRHDADQVVSAAKKFFDFLGPPAPPEAE